MVRSGEDTPVDVRLEPGVGVTIRLTPPPDAPWWKVMAVRVRDSAGAPHIERSIRLIPTTAP